MKKLFFILFCFLLFFTACDNGRTQFEEGNFKLGYAKTFTVDEHEGYTTIKLVNPWDTTKLLQSYVLVDRNKALPDTLPEGILVRTPIRSAVVYSTVNCTTLKELDALDVVKGVCESNYIKISEIQEGIKNGTIMDVGEANNPDVEKILMLEPEVIFASPIAGQGFGRIEKTKIPIIQILDYLENEPLARTEWIRFYSFFVDRREKADALFDAVAANYNEVKDLVSQAEKRPSVFTDLQYQGSWNMPGGKSYLALMLADAGGDYVWSDDNSNKFLPLTFESVLDRAGDADIWLIKYYANEDMTYKSLQREYKGYSHFRAYKERHIYACNTVRNDYFGDLPIRPDSILKDMAAIFHPDLFPDHQPVYYEKLTE